MNYNRLVYVLLLVSFIGLGSSPGLPVSNTGPLGISVVGVDLEGIKINTSREAVAHIYNTSNGLALNSGVSCAFEVYDTQNNGTALYTNNTPRIEGNEFYFLIPNTVYTRNGYYTRVIECNNTAAGIGGYYTSTFYANVLGERPDVAGVFLYFFLFIIMVMLTFGLIYGTMKLPTNNPRFDDGRVIKVEYLKYLRPFGFGLAYLSVWAIFFYFGNLTGELLPDGTLGKFLFTLSNIMIWALIPIVIIIILKLIDDIMNDLKIKRLIERGIDVDD